MDLSVDSLRQSPLIEVSGKDFTTYEIEFFHDKIMKTTTPLYKVSFLSTLTKCPL